MSFKNLKRNRGNIQDLVKAAEKSGGGEKKSYGDDRFWKPSRDKSGNGYAVIRFLPAPEGEDIPWIQYWDHGFQGPTGRWYIENSLTSIGQQDPVSDHNSALWATGREEDKETARKQKRRLHYVSNIYVVSDPSNPENEGKTFLYKFGKKIFDKIMEKMQPQYPDEQPINPFDFWEGADFKVKIRQVQGWVNYDSSEFAASTEFLNGDEPGLEEVYNKMNSLQEFVDPKSYKTYAELETKMNAVLGAAASMSTAESISLDESTAAPVTKSIGEKAYEKPAEKEVSGGDSEDDDDTLAYFAKLAGS